MRHPLSRLTLLSVATLLFFAWGCNGTSPEAHLAFLAIGERPAGGTLSLQQEDDVDPGTPGIQVPVTLRAEARVILVVGDTQLESEPDAEGKVHFESVTLRPGENALVAEDEIGDRVAAVVTVNAPSLSISGDPNHVLSCVADDRDPETPGMQISLLVRAPRVPESTLLTLWVGEVRYEATVTQQQALVPVTFPDQSEAVWVRAEATVSGHAIATERPIQVQCAGCDLLSVAGRSAARSRPEDPILVGPAQDTSSEPGMQASLKVRADGLPGTQVTLKVDGETVAAVSPDSDGIAHFAGVTLPERATLDVTCSLAGASDEASRATVLYDATPPPAVTDLACFRQDAWVTCSWTQPEDPDDIGPLASWSIRYLAGHELEPEQWAEATPVATLPSPENAGLTMVALFQLEPSVQGTVTLALQSQDAVGNLSPLSNRVTLQP